MAEANALEMKRREQELAARRAEIAASKANIALIDSQLADTIAALAGGWRGAGEIGRRGRGSGAREPRVVTVGDIDHPWLRGYVNETDLGKVKLGVEGEGDHRFVSRARSTTGA